jgi:hypothetical protein
MDETKPDDETKKESKKMKEDHDNSERNAVKDSVVLEAPMTLSAEELETAAERVAGGLGLFGLRGAILGGIPFFQ